jgi:hypothetical protein
VADPRLHQRNKNENADSTEASKESRDQKRILRSLCFLLFKTMKTKTILATA